MVQLSAFNTPQFDWGRTTLDRQPQPLPPIFQPELAAEAIVRAALEPRREWWVGWPAAKAMLAQRLVPGLLDRLLATRAYSSQHTGEPLPEGRHDNLYAPAPGHAGAHGRFDARSRPYSVQLWLTMRRWALAAGAIVALGVLGVWLAA
jgi:hypothetical protein